MKGSQPLKWHGGKSYLAPWIISHFAPHLHYVEPYFGAGSVLFARDPNRDWMYKCYNCTDNQYRMADGLDKKQIYICNGCGTRDDLLPASDRGCSEVVNDINGELAGFWSILAHEESFGKLHRILQGTTFSEEHWNACSTISANDPDVDSVMRAVAFFVRYRQSRQGLGKDFATLSRTRTRRNMNEQVSSWLSAVEGLPEAHERLKRVVILNRDALDVIKQQDGEKTLFYLDPPYLHDTRSSTGEYDKNEMSFDAHGALVDMLCEIKGRFLLSGYHSVMYDSMAKAFNWRCEEKQIDNKASSKATKEIKTECLWMNF